MDAVRIYVWKKYKAFLWGFFNRFHSEIYRGTEQVRNYLMKLYLGPVTLMILSMADPLEAISAHDSTHSVNVQ